MGRHESALPETPSLSSLNRVCKCANPHGMGTSRSIDCAIECADRGLRTIYRVRDSYCARSIARSISSEVRISSAFARLHILFGGRRRGWCVFCRLQRQVARPGVLEGATLVAASARLARRMDRLGPVPQRGDDFGGLARRSLQECRAVVTRRGRSRSAGSTALSPRTRTPSSIEPIGPRNRAALGRHRPPSS